MIGLNDDTQPTCDRNFILINNFNFDEKSLIYFKKFTKKEQIVLIFQNSISNWD